MKAMFSAIDGLLRGSRTSDAALRDNATALPARLFVPAAIILGCIYGFFMGWYAIANRETMSVGAQQALASMVKLPALFLLTLGVTFPSLYVFNALVGCRLGLKPSLRLLVSAIVVNLAVSASMGPIVGFFALSTSSYPFMVVLNITLLAIGGGIGLGFLFRMLRRLASQAAAEEFDSNPSENIKSTAVSEPLNVPAGAQVQMATWRANVFSPREVFIQGRVGSATLIFWVWVVLYGAVGAQMGWLLRPFIGHPNAPFSWFRPRIDNFFIGAGQNLLDLLSGK
jgi:hypothetical protein